MIAWSKSGTASISEVRDGFVTVHSSVPFPPGTPAEGTLTDKSETKHTFVLKIAGSRKIAEGTWEVRGRLVSATVAVLAAFASFQSRVET